MQVKKYHENAKFSIDLRGVKASISMRGVRGYYILWLQLSESSSYSLIIIYIFTLLRFMIITG